MNAIKFHSQLSDLARLPCHGTFEAHLTIQADSPIAQHRFLELCTRLGVKAVLIELAHGTHSSQPMTASYHHGRLNDAIKEIESLHATLCESGFVVVRVKIEAVAVNEGVPANAAETQSWPAACYFEFHVKLLLAANADLEPLQQLSERHQARVSSNARRLRSDGHVERFLTQRVYGVGRMEAFECFDRLLADLDLHGFQVMNQQREYTIFDSDGALDQGWLDVPEDPE